MQSNGSTQKVRGRTSTQEILGNSVPPGKTHRKWTEQQRQLLALRDWFLGKRSAVTQNARGEIPASGEHMADAASESYDRDYALALLSSAQNALYEIDQALNRIASGTYGICEMSGQPIEAGRLKAIPWTRFSASSQAKLEARGAGGRIQLGERGSCLKAASGFDLDVDEAEEEPAGATA
jgi:RNA polymerase-binding transcription factor DksA